MKFVPERSKLCSFCGLSEDIFHMYTTCARLKGIFQSVEQLASGITGKNVDRRAFIFGLDPKAGKANKLCNFIFNLAKKANLITRSNKEEQKGLTDIDFVFKILLKARMKTDFSYYKVIRNINKFKREWLINDILGQITINQELTFNF